MQRRPAHVERDHVAVLDQRQRAAGRGLGRHVQNDRAVRGAAHARVGDADHVGDALAQKLLAAAACCRPRPCPDSLSGRVFQHHHAVLIDVEVRIVDAGVKVLDVLEDDRAAAVLQQVRAWPRTA